MKLRNRICKKLKTIRRVKEISQETIAFETKTAQAHISEIEKGDVNFTIDTLEKIMKALNISLSDLTN